MKARLLIVDTDARYREWLRHHIGVLCPDGVVTTLDLDRFHHTYELLTRNECDLLLLATHFGESPEDPHSHGLEWLRRLREIEEFPCVLVIAEGGNELTAVRAIQLGAIDYIPKRLLTPERVKTSVRLALRRIELQAGECTSDRIAVFGTAVREPIPGYLIRKTIGESEKAMVYLAESAALQRDVALKVSKLDSSTNEEEHRALARERAAIATIRHHSIVEIYDHGEHEGREYLAMEYFPRGDLKARLQRGILEGDSLRYVEQIARALQVVHDAGILHRDLKPPNVMVRENDDLVLIDFGLARAMESGRSTRTGVLRGSPYYMSPEQALGEELDVRTDLYALGIIFFEMLTGRKPFTGTSAMDVLQQHVNTPPPRLSEDQSHLQLLLDGLLAKSRDDRFSSAAQVVEAVSGMRALREAESTAA
jgi:eukaryotic-like serine/threonine-protein kinase